MSQVREKPKKAHRAAQAGVKAEKKKQKQLKKNGSSDQKKKLNPKGFGHQSAVNAHLQRQRNVDREHKGHHIVMPNRAEVNFSLETDRDPAPILIAVVGPKGSGKSTLIRCLVKHYTKYTLGGNDNGYPQDETLNEQEEKEHVQGVTGPITVVSGKNRRLTFFEVGTDLFSMIDMAKTADLVLMTVDASFGFEMETFEFLNVAQTHGFPRIMGVLTHLDKFRNVKTVRNLKTSMKQRFWSEIYDGAKMFYISGIRYGKYPKNEITNLARFISVMKFRPLVWRNSHSYLLVDRVEDITDPALVEGNPSVNRRMSFYGYIRGTNLKPTQKLHLIGVGDFEADRLSVLPDPCPLPERNPETQKRKGLKDKQKLLYAPMANVGDLVFDSDAVYINIKDSGAKASGGARITLPQDSSESDQQSVVKSLQDLNMTVDQQLGFSEIRLFKDSKPIRSNDVAAMEGQRRKALESGEECSVVCEGSDDEEDLFLSSQTLGNPSGEEADQEQDVGSQGDDEEDEEDEDEEPVYSDEEEFQDVLRTSSKTVPKVDLEQFIYGDLDHSGKEEEEDGSDAEDDDDFFRVRKTRSSLDSASGKNSTASLKQPTLDWTSEENLAKLRKNFIGGWNHVDEDQVENDDQSNSKEEKENEEGEESLQKETSKELKKQQFNAEYDREKEDGAKDYFDMEKEQINLRMAFNTSAFSNVDEATRLKLEGARPGRYVRIEISDLPCEFATNLNFTHPIVLGALLPGEDKLGFVQLRFKRHRWHPKILKNRDPLIFSVGWRRFQSIPIYSITDANGRNRMLKYTPEHMHCMAAFYGPVTPVGSGVIAFQYHSANKASFRVSGTGVVLQMDDDFRIVKKLKLTGVPYEVHRNTAFIKDMFSSSLEAAKFEGAAIRTVSGIRGQIKKALTGGAEKEGRVRVTFEDKIMMSDIVFMRSWTTVSLVKFYNPVTSLLSFWTAMKPIVDLRRERNLTVEFNPDSAYHSADRTREKKVFKPLLIPTSLKRALPFHVKAKLETRQPPKEPSSLRPVVIDPKEAKVDNLISQLAVLRADKIKKKQVKDQQRLKTMAKVNAHQEKEKETRKKAKRKAEFQAKGRPKKKAKTSF